MAGHDIDYIAIAGALEPLGRAGQPPTPPINVIGDFAGGGMLLAFGIVAALFERERTGVGQVIDAAMIDGAALMLTPFYAAPRPASGDERGTNLLDTGAPFYEVYETADGKWIAVGAIEPQFYAAFVAGLGLDADTLADRRRSLDWPELKTRVRGGVPSTHPRRVVHDLRRHRRVRRAGDRADRGAPTHPHNVARGAGSSCRAGVPQPAPGPRFSAHPDPEPAPPCIPAPTPPRYWRSGASAATRSPPSSPPACSCRERA